MRRCPKCAPCSRPSIAPSGVYKGGGLDSRVGSKAGASQLADNGNSITYRVRKGDSFASIAKRHGVNTKDVMRWNSDAKDIQPGDKLTLFVKNSATPDT